MKPSHPIRRLILLALLAPVAAAAQGPELSADQPIAFSAETGLLIAAGNAVFVDADTRVEADEIRYDRNREHVEASGNVRVTRDGLRLLTHHLTYNVRAKTFSAGAFRAGYPPLFMDGEAFSGSLDELDFSRVNLYYREPVAWSPRLAIRSGKWTVDESLSGSGLRLKVLGDFGLPLPAIRYGLGSPVIEVDAAAGFQNSMGAFLQTFWLYPVTPQFSAGGNFDLYSRRGVLVGPAVRWRSASGLTSASLNTGWIHDHDFGRRGRDILQNPIEQDRGFADFSVTTRDADGQLQLQARSTWLSDSEVQRDFRRSQYFRNYQPDHFADFTWQRDSFLLNVFARTQLNDSYRMVERLPEVSAEWLPTELGQTGVHLQASAAATRYRLQELVPGTVSIAFPANPLGLPGAGSPGGAWPADLQASTFHNRLDGALTLTRPVHLAAGVDLVLRAGGRWTHYHREARGTLPSLNGDRWIGELGFDLGQTLVRTWSFDRPAWDISRLRHTSRLSMQYRWHPGAGDGSAAMPAFDLLPYHSRPPVLDLADLRHLDGLREWSVARFGWEHRLLAAAKDAAFRDLLAFNLYQDLRLDASAGEDAWDALYADLDFTPFPWLRLQWTQKIRPEDPTIEATFVRIGLRSADLWSLDFRAEYLRNAIDQYVLAARYRVSENLGLLASWHYDARLEEWTEQRYGFSRRFGNVWQLEVYVSLNQGDDREGSFSTGMRLEWLAF